MINVLKDQQETASITRTTRTVVSAFVVAALLSSASVSAGLSVKRKPAPVEPPTAAPTSQPTQTTASTAAETTDVPPTGAPITEGAAEIMVASEGGGSTDEAEAADATVAANEDETAENDESEPAAEVSVASDPAKAVAAQDEFEITGDLLTDDLETAAEDSAPEEPEEPLLLAGANMRSMIAEPDESLFSTQWRAVRGGERTDSVNRVVTRMYDFTTIAAGQTMSYSSGRNDAWIVAIDADGEKLWEQVIGGARDDEARDLVLVDKGDVIVVGSTESVENRPGPVGLIARIDAEGNLLWQKFVEQERPHPLTAVTLLPTGEGVAFGAVGNAVKMYRFSVDGERITEHDVDGCQLDAISAAVTNSSGDVLIGGEKSDFLDLIGSMCRISPDGTAAWQVDAESGTRSEVSDLAAIGDDAILVGFHLAETGDDQALAIRVDAEGNKLWTKSLGTNTSERFLALNVLSDNRILVLGSITDQEALQSRHWIMALSEAGEVLESLVGDPGEALTLMDLAPRPDGRYVVVGRKTDDLNREINGYIALMGVQNLSIGEQLKASGGAAAPSVVIPGEGSIITEKPATEILGNVLHNRPIARVFVNGQATRLLQNGAFRTSVSTPMGRTTITVSAVDDLGNVGEAKVDVIRRESVQQEGEDLEQILANTNFGSYHAILIGNQRYSNGIDTLDTPYKDVDVLSDILTGQYGFEVDVLKDATRKQMLEAIDSASQALGPSDNLLIYYAGHGHYDKDYDQGYWLPVDATADDRTTWIESGAVKELIKRMNAKHVLLVADSCFSGTLLRSVNNQRSSKFYEIIAERTARLAMTSGNIEPVMDGGGDGHSVFARHFITTLQSDRPIIDGTYLYNSVREPVVTQSGQMPQYSNIRFLESDGGDFLFVKRQ